MRLLADLVNDDVFEVYEMKSVRNRLLYVHNLS